MKNSIISYITAVLTAVLMCSSCWKEDPVPVIPEKGIDFTAVEERISKSGDFNVRVSIKDEGRQEWRSLAFNVDGKPRKDLYLEGRLFVDSPDVLVYVGEFHEGRHSIEVTMTDKRDSVAVRRVGFNVIGEWKDTGPTDKPSVSLPETEYRILLGAEAGIMATVRPTVSEEDLEWSISGDACSIVRIVGAMAQVRGERKGVSVLTASLKGTESSASVVLECVEEEDVTRTFEVNAERDELFEGVPYVVTVSEKDGKKLDGCAVKISRAGCTAFTVPLDKDVTEGDVEVKRVSESSATVTICGLPVGADMVVMEFMKDGMLLGQTQVLDVMVKAVPSLRFEVYETPECSGVRYYGDNGLAVMAASEISLPYSFVKVVTDSPVTDLKFTEGTGGNVVSCDKVGENLWKVVSGRRGRSMMTVRLGEGSNSVEVTGLPFIVFDVVNIMTTYEYQQSIFRDRMINSARIGFRVPVEGYGDVSGIADMTTSIQGFEDGVVTCSSGKVKHSFGSVSFGKDSRFMLSFAEDIWNLYYAAQDAGTALENLSKIGIYPLYEFRLNDDLVWVNTMGSDYIEGLNAFTSAYTVTTTISADVIKYNDLIRNILDI